MYEIPSATTARGADDVRRSGHEPHAGAIGPFEGFRSFAVHAAGPLECACRDGVVTVRRAGQVLARFACDGAAGSATGCAPDGRPAGTLRVLEWTCATAEAPRVVLAALDALFANGAAFATMSLQLDSPHAEAGLQAAGAAVRTDTGLWAGADMLWQIAELWTTGPAPVYPLRHAMTGGKRHPLRPAKPRGVAYARYIPWLRQTLTLRAAGLERDLPLLHRWMNDPDVDAFWQEAGPIEKHRAYLSGLIDDPHMLPLIASFDDQPFGYFEVYWARENRIAPFYDAQDHDRGWHVLIGEPAFRGRAFLTAWFPSIQHFQFLDDPRTQRIVGEPRADHERQLANLDKAGFARVKTFDFPHKRAVLVMLLREEFFGRRLLLPQAGAAAQP